MFFPCFLGTFSGFLVWTSVLPESPVTQRSLRSIRRPNPGFPELGRAPARGDFAEIPAISGPGCLIRARFRHDSAFRDRNFYVFEVRTCGCTTFLIFCFMHCSELHARNLTKFGSFEPPWLVISEKLEYIPILTCNSRYFGKYLEFYTGFVGDSLEIMVIKICFEQAILVQFFVGIQIKPFVIKSEHVSQSCGDFLASTLRLQRPVTNLQERPIRKKVIYHNSELCAWI